VSSFRVRSFDRESEAELDLVAERMRLTLIEVLGEATGGELYSHDWLRARVRWHLDPQTCVGEVFVAEGAAGQVLGHTIVRLEPTETDAPPEGLFATTYVTPDARRQGVAEALLERGERWLLERGVTTLATATSETNQGLIRLFEGHGYAITLRVPERSMLRLTKAVEP